MGIGDFLVKLYAICHLNKFIKDKYNCYTIFIIEEYQTNILNQIINIDFFKEYFNEFYIQYNYDSIAHNIGNQNVNFDNQMYFKKYSAINTIDSNRRGYWEIYANIEDNLDIDYINFDYRDPSSRNSKPIPDYNLPIFRSDIVKKAEEFVQNNLKNNFDCIFYRALGELDKNHISKFINNLKGLTDQTFFITSNSQQAIKDIINNITINNNKVITYNNLNHQTIDGYGTAKSDESRILDLVTEMIIMSYANKIHYGGNHSYISLFNYYAHLVKQIPLIYYQ